MDTIAWRHARGPAWFEFKNPDGSSFDPPWLISRMELEEWEREQIERPVIGREVAPFCVLVPLT